MMPLARLWGLLLSLAVFLTAQTYPVIPIAHSPRNIEHVLQDRQGRLWISTHDDILCFDGERFLSLRQAGFPAVLGNSLAEDDEGAILSGTPLGVYRFFQGHLEHLLPGMNVADVIGVAPGVLLATVSGNPWSLYRMRRIRGEWLVDRIADWWTAVLTRDRAGDILSPCPGGWCELPAQAILANRPDFNQRVFHRSNLDIGRVLRDGSGCLWFRSPETAAYQCPNDPQPVLLPAPIAGRNTWFAESETDDGDILFASFASVAIGRPGAFQALSTSNGLPPEAVTCAVRARDGTIWIGSIGGLYRFPYPFRMTVWKSPHGLFSAFARSGGAMFAGTSTGVARLDKSGAWTVLSGSRDSGSISSLVPDSDGSLWAAVSRQAVIKLAATGNLEARTPPDRGGEAGAVARAADGSIWMAGGDLYRVTQKGRNLSLTVAAGAGAAGADLVIASDRLGNIWGCKPGNLIRYEAGEWKTVASGLPPSRCRSMAFPRYGEVWAGYWVDLAFVRLAARGTAAVRTYPGGRETGSTISYAFATDARGWLWRGSNDGIYVADEAQAQRGAWLRLNQADGLIDVDVNRGSLFSDRDGSIWWGAAASAVHFLPPPDLVRPSSPPHVFLSSFSINGKAPKFAENLAELPPGSKLTVYLGSLQFQGRNALRVRYRVLPERQIWRESASLSLDVGALGWGTHRLEIQSRFGTQEWTTTLSRRLLWLRPWWFSWPAILGFIGIGCGGAAGAMILRKKRLARTQNDLPDLAAWRMAVLSPESQMVQTTLQGRFQVMEMLARGGFATIFKGRDLHIARACAIKVFRRDVLDDHWLTHRFEQEVAALEQIHHPSVVSIYGSGIAGGAPYLVMEFIEGGTLRELLAAGPLPLGRTASLLRQAAGALERIHQRGIYHRDMKPENLMLRPGASAEEDLVLIDFSIAIVKEPDQTMHGLSRAAGTIYYMAPEQAVGFATPASDIYSLAKILVEMLTGQRLSALLPKAAMDLPECVRELARSLPIRLSEESVELLGSALEFDPARRPQTAMQFARPLVRDLTAASSAPAANPCP